jgi:hypothetical protein
MPLVDLGTAPDFGANAKYTAYRDWLLRHFFRSLCSYCLLRDDNLEIDHYEPSKFAPNREHDPTNLLLGCGRCNGRGGKSDYHPHHKARTRLPHDTSGHLVLDVRVDDFAGFFEVRREGQIRPRPGSGEDRAAWNVALLKLDLEPCDTNRRELQNLLEACEMAVVASREATTTEDVERWGAVLTNLLPELAGRRLFFDVFGLRVSDELRGQLDRVTADLVGVPA